MKRVFAVVVGFLMLLMFSGVALCSDAAPAAKQKSVKKSSAAVVKAPYVSVQGGVAFLTDSDLSDTRSGTIDFDYGYALGVAVGYKLGKIRAEGEIGYQKNEVDKCDSSCRSVSGDMKAYTFLVNGYYDFVNKTRLTPYITAGIGVAKVDADVNNYAHVEDTAFAYQVGAGIAYAVTKQLAVDLKYRYLDTVEDFGFENTNPEFSTHNVLLGLRYNF